MEIRKYAAEVFGTAVLVFIGCGAVTAGTYSASLPIGAVPIGLAFGLTVTALIYSVGPISGCHINPAVTLSLWAAGRFEAKNIPGYIVSQLVGAAVGAGLLLVVLNGGVAGGYDLAARGLGQNGWGAGFLGAYDVFAAFVTEFVSTAVFVAVILGAFSRGATQSLAGIAIGAALMVLIIAFLNVTGVSLNPARSFGPALFVGRKAMSQLWLFLIAPCLAGLLTGLFFREAEGEKAARADEASRSAQFDAEDKQTQLAG
jgi:aquaporin Z